MGRQPIPVLNPAQSDAKALLLPARLYYSPPSIIKLMCPIFLASELILSLPTYESA